MGCEANLSFHIILASQSREHCLDFFAGRRGFRAHSSDKVGGTRTKSALPPSPTPRHAVQCKVLSLKKLESNAKASKPETCSEVRVCTYILGSGVSNRQGTSTQGFKVQKPFRSYGHSDTKLPEPPSRSCLLATFRMLARPEGIDVCS